MKEVIIAGLAWPVEYCHFDCKDVWTCNTGYLFTHIHTTKLFLMHKQVIKNGFPEYNWGLINRLSQRWGFDIISKHKIKELNSNLYPFKTIVKKYKTEYFTSSLDYMIAYALYEGFEKIRLYGLRFFEGVSQVTDDLFERCGLEYWVGYARGTGVIVEDASNGILKTRTGKPYAWEG